MKSAYLTLLGRSSWAVINSLYGVLDSGLCCPNYVHLFVEELYGAKIPKVITGIHLVCEAYGYDVEVGYNIVGNAKFVNSGMQISEEIHRLQKLGFEIALDITPGRKSLIAASLLSVEKLGVKHVFYLAVDNIEDIPLMLKPKKDIHLRDFLKEVQQVQS